MREGLICLLIFLIGKPMNENAFQASFIKKLKSRFHNVFIFKNDPNYRQGVPDLLVLIGERWFAFEVKKSAKARHQPNQDYYVDLLDQMSYARFVYPENESDILDEIQRSLKS